MSDPVLAVVFLAGMLVSLTASWSLVTALERVGTRLGLSESLLGMLAALAADGPEITAAVTALVRGESRIGAGVILGSNVFNVAALIGLAGIVAGHIALHPRVVELGGAVAVWVAAVALLLVLGVLPAAAALPAALVVFAPYLALLGARHSSIAALPLPARWTRWLVAAIVEEEQDLQSAIHPRRGGARDGLVALVATAVVIGASIAMERSASKLGAHWGVPAIVVGAIVLAVVTSLPNAVAGVYLASRGRGAAVLSTSLNSNAINIIAGLLVPSIFLGVASPSAQTTLVAGSALAITLLALLFARTGRGVGRGQGLTIVAVYLAVAATLIATSS